MLQVQNGRFIQNWRKQTGASNYPHYEATRAAFGRDWNRFLGFLKDLGLDAPVVNQCEVSYVNHIEVGDGWHWLSEAGHVIPMLDPLAQPELPAPEAFLINVRYLLPDKRARACASTSCSQKC